MRDGEVIQGGFSACNIGSSYRCVGKTCSKRERERIDKLGSTLYEWREHQENADCRGRDFVCLLLPYRSHHFVENPPLPGDDRVWGGRARRRVVPSPPLALRQPAVVEELQRLRHFSFLMSPNGSASDPPMSLERMSRLLPVLLNETFPVWKALLPFFNNLKWN